MLFNKEADRTVLYLTLKLVLRYVIIVNFNTQIGPTVCDNCQLKLLTWQPAEKSIRENDNLDKMMDKT